MAGMEMDSQIEVALFNTFQSSMINQLSRDDFNFHGFGGVSATITLAREAERWADRMGAYVTVRQIAGKPYVSDWVNVPDGVWQMIKDRWAPKWFLKRYPVRGLRIPLLTQMHLCGHIKPEGRKTRCYVHLKSQAERQEYVSMHEADYWLRALRDQATEDIGEPEPEGVELKTLEEFRRQYDRY